MVKKTKKFFSKIGKIKSRKKLLAIRENGKQPCKFYQRGRPRIHEACGSPMKRLDQFRHYCDKCKTNVFVDKVYIRPDRIAQPSPTV